MPGSWRSRLSVLPVDARRHVGGARCADVDPVGAAGVVDRVALDRDVGRGMALSTMIAAQPFDSPELNGAPTPGAKVGSMNGWTTKPVVHEVFVALTSLPCTRRP